MKYAITHINRELLQQVAGGSHAAFEILYNHYWKKVYHSAFQVLQSATAAQDALQEIFIKVWVNREQLQEMDYFPAWFHTVIRNHLYYKLRQQAQVEKHLGYLVQEEPESFSDRTYQETELKELVALVQAAMDKLTPQQRRVFELSRLHGLKHREIAAEMNLSQETVKKYIMEALRQVRDHLRDHGKHISVILLLQLVQA